MNLGLLYRFLSEPCFIAEGYVSALLQMSMEIQAAEHPRLKELRQSVQPTMSVTPDGIAVVPIEGVMARNPQVWEMLFDGVEDTRNVQNMLDTAATDPRVKGAVLAFDSPGGFITGGPEAADSIAEMSKAKPTLAYTAGNMCSLASWMGSQADHVIASRSAQVGSIGAYTAVTDVSQYMAKYGVSVEVIKNAEAQYKAIGVPGTSLTADQRTHLQDRIQSSFGGFRSDVLKARPQIPADAMRGQVLSGMEAKSAGLIDGVGDMPYAMGVMRQMMRSRQS